MNRFRVHVPLGLSLASSRKTPDLVRNARPHVVVMASFVALAFTGRRWLHTAVILLWLVVFNVNWWRLTLG